MEKPFFEAEYIEGFEPFVFDEVKKIGGRISRDPESIQAGVIRFRFGKSLTRLQKLRVVNQVFRVHTFDVPRPKALLGQQHFDRIRLILRESIKQLGPKSVHSFRLEAAGRDSAVFQRLIAQIETELKIPHEPDAGDLYLRVKPVRDKKVGGWELLVRQSVRPLATRAWRQFNYPGALAGPVAAVMLDMAAVQPDEAILNIMCGSGSLLAENSDHVGLMAGIDLNGDALAGGRRNLRAAGSSGSLFPADATKLPFANESFDVLLSDFPWGQLIGEVDEIEKLYPLVLREAWRVAKVGARFVIVTQLKKLMGQSIRKSDWELVERLSLNMGRVNPDIFLLEK